MARGKELKVEGIGGSRGEPRKNGREKSIENKKTDNKEG